MDRDEFRRAFTDVSVAMLDRDTATRFHGSCALPDGQPMTRDEVAALQDGERIVVIWSGGNGPHEYVVERNASVFNDGVFAVRHHANGEKSMNRLDFIGVDKPFTRVWRKV